MVRAMMPREGRANRRDNRYILAMFKIVFLHIIMDVWRVVISSDIIVGEQLKNPICWPKH
jgi:hypothetical protein